MNNTVLLLTIWEANSQNTVNDTWLNFNSRSVRRCVRDSAERPYFLSSLSVKNLKFLVTTDMKLDPSSQIFFPSSLKQTFIRNCYKFGNRPRNSVESVMYRHFCFHFLWYKQLFNTEIRFLIIIALKFNAGSSSMLSGIATAYDYPLCL